MKLIKITAYQCDYCEKRYLKLDDALECEESCNIKKYECKWCGNQNIIKGTRCFNCGEIA